MSMYYKLSSDFLLKFHTKKDPQYMFGVFQIQKCTNSVQILEKIKIRNLEVFDSSY